MTFRYFLLGHRIKPNNKIQSDAQDPYLQGPMSAQTVNRGTTFIGLVMYQCLV